MSKVKFASSEGLKPYSDLLKSIDSITRTKHLMVSDEVIFSMYVGCGSFEEWIVDDKYRAYIKSQLSIGLGMDITEEVMKMTLVEACKMISQKRTNFKPYQPENFLGVTNFTDFKEKGSWKLSYPFSVKSHVDYLTGYLHAKSDTLKGNPEMVQGMLTELQKNKFEVYGDTGIDKFEITTEEGDVVRFKNMYQVCCWVRARASNYDEALMTRENW